ncbi:MAG TPA: choline ABC transporter ATP-binding protein [Aestuariivirgaceae bacterium]|nr:choline ABC transporter ATP-binding protein [Aestuariivirgaceae bacterium]
MKTPAVSFRHVDIIFGRQAADGLALLDKGATRSEILEKTGAVLGCADATLDVGEGEICVMMGLSGSGKSTLLRAVNGLNRPVRGEVLVKEGDKVVDTAKCDRDTLRRMRMTRVAMVFQQFALLPWRTVEQNVGFGLELSGLPDKERHERVAHQLKLVGLDQWARKYAHELSGGMQQRVGLARAFATEAPILLMDEPFSALDPLIRTHLQDELLSLQRKLKRTIVFVSHDLDEALKIGTRIAIMEAGRVVQYGVPQDIVLKPANAYVADFVAHMNPLNVLTGDVMMRKIADLKKHGHSVTADDGRGVHITLSPTGLPTKATMGGKTLPVVAVEPEQKEVPAGSIAVMPAHSTMRSIIEMRRSSGLPVLLANGSKAVGVVGDDEIYAALMHRVHS